jgi:hypothetical protein
MRQWPETRYVRTPEGAAAWQVLGAGPPDLLFIQNWASNIEVMWRSRRSPTTSSAWRRSPA